jgi:hypothetical protein
MLFWQHRWRPDAVATARRCRDRRSSGRFLGSTVASRPRPAPGLEKRHSDVLRLDTSRGTRRKSVGLYLGDGCINRQGPQSKGVWKLRIMCADAWPGLMEQCRQGMLSVPPGNSVSAVHREGCVEVVSYSKHWPCLFPQHGPGRKHERKIELESWQRDIVSSHPGDFARGLFHSDGCRLINRVRRPLKDGDRWYEYPRYLFVN